MKTDTYMNIKRDKIQSYLKEGFTEEQIKIPLEKILIPLNVIVSTYKEKTVLNKWNEAAHFLSLHMQRTSNRQKDPGNNEYLYERVRDFLEEKSTKIDGLKWIMELPHEEKLPRYAKILSEIAKDCISTCVEEFRKDTEITMQLVKEKLVNKKGEEEVTTFSKLGKNYLTRLEKIRTLDNEWRAFYITGKDNDSTPQSVTPNKVDEIEQINNRDATTISNTVCAPEQKKTVTWAESLVRSPESHFYCRRKRLRKDDSDENHLPKKKICSNSENDDLKNERASGSLSDKKSTPIVSPA